MTINCVWEHNGRDTFALCGGFCRHIPAEKHWKPLSENASGNMLLSQMVRQKAVTSMDIAIIGEKVSELAICDADSDVLLKVKKHR